MQDYVIFSDSTSDLPVGLAAELELEIIPYNFRMDGKDYLNYLDNREFDPHEFYECLKSGKTSSTSLVTSYRFTEAFEPFFKEGKDILHLCFSSGLSGSYGQALIAADELTEKYPGRRLIIIDTLCASLGQGLISYYAAKEKAAGKSIEQVADFVRDMIPKLCHWFTVDDLNHLKRGGRVSGASAAIGTLLSIKPILHVDDEGRLSAVDKVRGRVKSLEYLADRMEKSMLPPKDQPIFISHSDALDDAKKLAAIIENRIGSKEFVFGDIGPVIGTHTGPGTITLFYLGDKR